eukprot:5794270-Pyramimonas_sp.AAC.1
MGQRGDQFAVAMRVNIPAMPNFDDHRKATPVFRVNRRALADPRTCLAFQSDLWAFRPPGHSHYDDHLKGLNQYVRDSALRRREKLNVIS